MFKLFIFLFVLPIFNIPSEFYEKLLAVRDGYGYGATFYKDGVYINFPTHLIKEPSELSRKTINHSNEKVLDITRPAPYRFAQKDGSFNIEELHSISAQWVPFFRDDIPGTCSYFPEFFLDLIHLHLLMPKVPLTTIF